MENGNVERVLTMASGAADAIRQRVTDLERIEGDLAHLDGRTCTGVEYWRRETGKPDRLYMNHSVDAACPMHGNPAPGARVRSYVGSDPDRIAEAREALAREKTRHDLEQEAQAIRHGLASCGYSLRQFYGTLGVRVGDDGNVVTAGDGGHQGGVTIGW